MKGGKQKTQIVYLIVYQIVLPPRMERNSSPKHENQSPVNYYVALK